MRTVHLSYDRRGYEHMSTQAIQTTLQQEVPSNLSHVEKAKKARSSKNKVVKFKDEERKELNEMTPTEQSTAIVQKTVFDLALFNDVLLKKEVSLPNRPKSVQECMEAIGNDTEKFISIFYEGLVEDAKSKAREDMAGFKVVDEDGNIGDEYSGNYADEK